MAQSYFTETVLVDSQQISYYRAGEQGSPVVLLHGGGTDSALLSWRYALPELAKSHRVFALDWPGYGKSDPLAGAYTLDRLVPILAGWMDQVGLERASLVGLSMGGGAAIAYALAYPRRVDHLVLVDTYGIQRKAPAHLVSYLYIRMPFLVSATWAAIRRDKGMTRSAVRSIFADPEGFTEEFVDELFEAVQSRSGERSFYSFQRYEMTLKGVRTNYVSVLPKIEAPTLFIHGDSDRLVPIAEIRQVVESMPDARLVVMDKTGHWPPREHPEQFNQLVLDFLKGTR